VALTADQILSLAPDAASAKAGSQLAAPSKWGQLGRDERALWGECQGSGKTPYRTQIDIGEPAFKCTCPSRKFPCKHGLGLYLLLSAQPQLFGQSSAPPWVGDWLQSRQQRQEKKLEKAAEQTPEQAQASAEQARKREEKREHKVDQGMADLQNWLHDLAREGLANVRDRGPAFWEGMAARLVDMQAGVLGARLRRAGAMCFQTTVPDWEHRLTRELASIYLLTTAWRRIDRLPDGLQRDIRGLAGFTVGKEEVLAEAPLADRWRVLAQRSSEEDRIRSRATWLHGVSSGRWALLLHYAAGSQGFDQAIAVGTEFEAELCFYPGALPMRALVSQQSPAQAIQTPMPATPDLATLLDRHADALAVHPFLDACPVMLADLSPDPANLAVWYDQAGFPVPLHPAFRHGLHLAALSGGHPVAVIGEWDGEALLPLSVWHDERLYSIETDLFE
jgi:hypothetical protein